MLDAEIVQITSDQLNEMFSNTPEGTPSAETVAINEENATPSEPATENADTPETVSSVEETDEEADEETNDDKIIDSNVPTILKNTVDYLIESGTWEDFEGREDLEMTQEVYADLALKQNEHKVNKMFDELVDQTGDYGKAILHHIKNGGDPDKVIDIFKEQKKIENTDISTDAGKASLVEKYYKEVLGWKDDRIKKTIARIIDDEELDTEVQDVKEHFDKYNKERIRELQEEIEAKEIVEKQRQQNFIKSITSTLESDTSLTPKDRKIVADSILNFKHRLDDGRKVNDFYIKFAQLQNDPKSYIELVKYVMNPEQFKNKISTQEQSNANAKAFNFIKGNAATTKASGVNIVQKESNRSKIKGTDFSLAIKK